MTCHGLLLASERGEQARRFELLGSLASPTRMSVFELPASVPTVEGLPYRGSEGPAGVISKRLGRPSNRAIGAAGQLATRSIRPLCARFQPFAGLDRSAQVDPMQTVVSLKGDDGPPPYLPFAIPVGTSGAAPLGGFTTFGSPMSPGGNSTVPLSAALIRSVDPMLGPPPVG